MATGIIYLDVDDEITSAANRIRRVEGRRVAVVLPHGSRVATSRINFRLLSRDAMTHEKDLSIVAPDGATRALAASAGLPVFASVPEYEEFLAQTAAVDRSGDGGDGPGTAARGEDGETPAEPAEPGAEPVAGRSREDRGPATADVAPPAAAATGAAATQTVGPRARPTDVATRPGTPPHGPTPPGEPVAPTRAFISLPVIGSRRRSIPRTPVLVGVAVLALSVLVAGVGAYALLPAATVVVTPREVQVGPLNFSVVADENVTAPDSARRVVPARRLTLEVTVDDTFPATGRRVEQTRATARVTFQSLDTGAVNRIPAGSIVSTEGGIRFRTLSAITLARAEIVPPLSVRPSTAMVDVRAVRPGPSGNVPANAITVVPPGENPSITKVRNANEATGGTREEFPLIDQADLDAAVAALAERLDGALQERLDDPSIAPEGTTIFRETAILGESTPTVDVTTLVGVETEEFELGLTADATVVAVNPAPVATVAESLLMAEIEADHDLVEGSTSISPGDPVVEGQVVSFPVVAEARQVLVPDPAALEALILGRPLDEARSLLEAYGDVELTLWPEWATNVPTIDARVEVEVRAPAPPDGDRPP